MANTWSALRSLIEPPGTEDVVLVVRLTDGGRSVVEYMGGGQTVVIGQTVGVGHWALIRDGIIIAEEPAMTSYEIFV